MQNKEKVEIYLSVQLPYYTNWRHKWRIKKYHMSHESWHARYKFDKKMELEEGREVIWTIIITITQVSHGFYLSI